MEGLPVSKGYSVIFVVIDHLTKYGHFKTLVHPYIAQVIFEEFMKNVFKLHRFPRFVVSDSDPIFLNTFCKAIFQSQGSSLDFSSTYHPNQMEKLKP